MTTSQDNTHGGQRKGAGRPRSPYLERVIKIRCTAAEYRAIIAETDPRQRAEIIMRAIESGEPTPSPSAEA